jgi:hypothetical protein
VIRFLPATANEGHKRVQSQTFEYSTVDISDSDAPDQRHVEQKETPPAPGRGCSESVLSVSAAVMVAGVLVLVGGLVDDGRLGGARCTTAIEEERRASARFSL